MEPQTKKFFKKHQILIVLLTLLLLAAAGAGAYYYNQYNKLNNILKNPNVAVEKQTKQLVDQVGKLIELPTDEQPTVATVTDASKLKDNAFFKNAQNGYKVLIYVKARKAILYDPVKNLIVDVGPVNISQNAQTTPIPTEEAQKVSTTPTSPSLTPTPTK